MIFNHQLWSTFFGGKVDAQTDERVHIEPDWDLAAQPAPDFEVDQRVNW